MCIVSKLLQVMYCKYCNVYCKLSFCKKNTIKNKIKKNKNQLLHKIIIASQNRPPGICEVRDSPVWPRSTLGTSKNKPQWGGPRSFWSWYNCSDYDPVRTQIVAQRDLAHVSIYNNNFKIKHFHVRGNMNLRVDSFAAYAYSKKCDNLFVCITFRLRVWGRG